MSPNYFWLGKTLSNLKRTGNGGDQNPIRARANSKKWHLLSNQKMRGKEMDYQTIERAPSRDKYTVIDNSAIRDKRLSFKARGVHHLLLSYADGWEVNVNHLINQSPRDKGEQRDGILAALKELEESGYLTRSQARNKNGTFQKGRYVVHELPVNGSTVNGSTDTYRNNNPYEKTEVNHHQHQEAVDDEERDFEAIALAEKAAYLAKQKLGEEIVRKRQRNFYQDAIWGVLAKEMGKDPKSVFEAFKSHVENHAKKAGKSDPVKWAEAVIHKLFEVEGSEANNSLWQEFEAIALGKITPLEKETGRKDLSASPPAAPEPSQSAREKLKQLRGGVA